MSVIADTQTERVEQQEDLLRSELDGGVRTILLDNPKARNALSTEMMRQLQDALDAAAEDSETRVIVIAGNGTAFCAGHDLKELTEARSHEDHGREFFTRAMRQCARLMQTIVGHPRPVIADIRGTATAAGCQLVASCDLAIASTDARFATPGVNIGLFCSTPMVALSRKIGQNHAMHMLLTGEFVGAEDAVRIGLINKAVDPAGMDAEIAALANRIASKSLMTLKTGKQAFYRQADMPLGDAYDYTADVMIENMLRRDAVEGVNAFLEKREPQWRDE